MIIQPIDLDRLFFPQILFNFINKQKRFHFELGVCFFFLCVWLCSVLYRTLWRFGVWSWTSFSYKFFVVFFLVSDLQTLLSKNFLLIFLFRGLSVRSFDGDRWSSRKCQTRKHQRFLLFRFFSEFCLHHHDHLSDVVPGPVLYASAEHKKNPSSFLWSFLKWSLYYMCISTYD